MSSDDIGESIVGSYLRHVRDCEIVSYNQYTRDKQGEIDVIGTPAVAGPDVWLCEVATHIGGLSYGGFDQNKKKITAKIDTAFAYADKHFPSHKHHFELWSPYVSKGQLTEWMDAASHRYRSSGRSVQFVVNEDYARCLIQLFEKAQSISSTTGEDAFRMLQIMARVRGAHLDFRLKD